MFEISLAYRHLISNRGQTALTVFAVGFAVVAIVFIQTVISGVQKQALRDQLEPLPQIIVKPIDNQPRTLAQIIGSQKVVGDAATEVQKRTTQKKIIEDWQKVERQLIAFPEVRSVASVAEGSGFLVRGSKRLSVTITGGDTAAVERIIQLQKHIVAGKWLSINTSEIVIGWRLADEAGVKLGDTVRIESSEGVTGSYRIAGIFATGLNQSDVGQIYTVRRTAQGLFRFKRDVSRIFINLKDPFKAEEMSQRIAGALPYKTDDWIRTDPTLLDAFLAQNAGKTLISLFALMASSFAVASVLIVSVIQKTKQIGILKSMGAKDRQILRVFTLEAFGVGLTGALIGAAIIAGLLLLLAQVKSAPVSDNPKPPGPVLLIELDEIIFTGACSFCVVSTLIAAIIPARNAAKMNPVEAIRG